MKLKDETYFDQNQMYEILRLILTVQSKFSAILIPEEDGRAAEAVAGTHRTQGAGESDVRGETPTIAET